MADGQPNISSSVERIKDLTEIPSPYLEGKLDEFFDGKLQPTIQTTRGCPFACTFCVEGTQIIIQKFIVTAKKKHNPSYTHIGSKMQDRFVIKEDVMIYG